MPLKEKCRSTAETLHEVYNLLYKIYGPRHWWPADNSFEVIVGAILTQNTSWSNVEKAILNLKKAGALKPYALHKLKQEKLAESIRSCGYYNIKAKRLKGFLNFLFSAYSGKIENMRRRSPATLRRELLNINGIGPETADSIILYAVKKPVFVIDAYTRRIIGCLGLAPSDCSYDEIQSIFMENLPRRVKLFNEYHALLVEHAKTTCKRKPACQKCILHSLKDR